MNNYRFIYCDTDSIYCDTDSMKYYGGFTMNNYRLEHKLNSIYGMMAQVSMKQEYEVKNKLNSIYGMMVQVSMKQEYVKRIYIYCDYELFILRVMYYKERFVDTPMNDEELEYCTNDVEALHNMVMEDLQ